MLSLNLAILTGRDGVWSVFPNIIRVSFEICPFAVTLGREIVCARLLQMHKTITALAENPRPPYYGPIDVSQARTFGRNSMTAEILIEQWKLYLIMACTTLNSVGAQSQSQLANAQHARKSSKGAQQSQDKISSARSLFAFVIPLLSAERDSIREAIVVAQFTGLVMDEFPHMLLSLGNLRLVR